MLRPLYNWVLRLAAGPYALPALAAVAFVEATFPMVPPDALLMPMVLARRERSFFYAAVCTAGSVLGGCVGYAIGYFLTPVGKAILEMTHPGSYAAFEALFARVGLAVILVKGLTPVPYMAITLASGLAHFSFPVFVGASIVTRGGRFFLETTLLQHPHAKAFIDKHLTVLAIVGVAVIVVLWLIIDHFGRHPV
jgi:membrane protein YqaA with SNARE-associated domain